MAATADERDFLDALYHLLAHKSEVVRLTWEDVNLEQHWMKLYTRKRRGGELQEDYLPMNGTLYHVLHNRWSEGTRQVLTSSNSVAVNCVTCWDGFVGEQE